MHGFFYIIFKVAMTDSNILDEMDLPLANPNEELETISKNYLRPLYDVSKFEIRSEDLRDKGIDLNIEIKKDGKHTNFRFVIQLKATDSIEYNQDNTLSLQIHTSNINYLMNAGVPAFYILYYKPLNKFYYEHLNEFVKVLLEKDSDWSKQKTHILRFSKELNTDGINEMYNSALTKGLFHRKISERFAENSATIKQGDKILFDMDLNVTGDAEIRSLIESIGFALINEGEWKQVLSIHKRASQNIATTAKYNFIIGLAHYYTGNLLDALNFFKYANKLKDELSDELKSHLSYFDTSIKFYMGMISVEEFENKITVIEKDSNISFYIRLEQAKIKYFISLESVEEYGNYEKEIKEIINDPLATSNIKLIAKCDLILFQGSKNNLDWVKDISLVNAQEIVTGPNAELRIEVARRFMFFHSAWYKLVHEVKQEALDEKNYFVYYGTIMNEVKVSYEIAVYSEYVHVSGETPGFKAIQQPDKIPSLRKMVSKLDEAFDYYNNVGHVENMVVALSRKYEILHFLEDINNANNTIAVVEDLINNYDLNGHKNKLENLKNAGTTHEMFKAWFNDIWERSNQQTEEIVKMVEEMEQMDLAEKSQCIVDSNFKIHLFPIGYFQVPVESKETMFQILGVSQEEIKDSFVFFFENGIVPIANIYNLPIIKEGYAEGRLSDRGIESWREIYRIRKAFFDNKFYRDLAFPVEYSPE